MSKRLIFCAFTMNTVSHIYHGLWRHPETRQLEYTNLDTWVDLANSWNAASLTRSFSRM